MKTELRGPAPAPNGDGDDIVDEVLTFFRANVLFRNFMIEGGADRALIYLTLHVVQLLVKCERIDDKATALRELRTLSRDKPFTVPGENGFVLGQMFPAPESKKETDDCRAWVKQAREECAVRLVARLFDKDGKKNKWWQSFSKRKFMGKELMDAR